MNSKSKTRQRLAMVLPMTVLVLAALVAACAEDMPEQGASANASFSQTMAASGSGGSIELPDRFSHDYHFRHFATVDCAQCHGSFHGDNVTLRPAPEVCLQCHASDMHESAHVFHLGLQRGIVCLDCHGANAPTTATTSPVCLECHRGTP